MSLSPLVLLSQPNRFNIVAFLHRSGGTATFSDIRSDLKITHATLSSHLRRLREADLVVVDRGIVKGRTLTTVKLTKLGRSCFAEFVRDITRAAAPELTEHCAA